MSAATTAEVPRPYQLELLDAAVARNVVAYLDTGSGKTLVSILLILRFASPLQPASQRAILDSLRRSAIAASSANGADPTTADPTPSSLPPPSSTSSTSVPSSSLPENTLLDDSNVKTNPTALSPSAGKSAGVCSDVAVEVEEPVEWREGEFELIQGVRLPKQPKKVVFCVPTIPLVHQQAEKIRQNTDLIVGEYSRDDNASLSYWDALGWYHEVSQRQVLVITPQIFLNILRHGFMSLREHVSLIIFDECHHATRNHPYTLIMQEYYHSILDPQCRPKVFGMTASPIYQNASTREASVQRLTELQDTLDCSVITVSERSSVESFVSKAIETIVEYDDDLMLPTEYISTSGSKFLKYYLDQLERIRDELKLQSDSAEQCEDLNKNIDQVRQIQFELGSWCAGKLAMRFCKTLTGLSKGAKRQKLSVEWKVSLDFAPPTVEEMAKEDVSKKVWVLVDLISQRASARCDAEEFRGMVFVEKRISAVLLFELFTAVAPSFFPAIKCGFITGHGTSSGQHEKMSATNQKRVLDRFRHGFANLLMVTNVAEEGIDIPACRLVIIFDRFRSNTGYVQSRGRARDLLGAEYIIMIRRNDIYAIDVVTQAKVAEVLTRSVASTLTNAIPGEKKLLRGEQDNALVDVLVGANDIYRTDLASATVSHAESVLFRYLKTKPTYELLIDGSSIPDFRKAIDFYSKLRASQAKAIDNVLSEKTGETIKHKEIDDVKLPFGFAFAVVLPNFEPPFNRICGAIRFTRKLAMQSAALEAVRYLHAASALNDHLLPVRRGKAKGKNFSFRNTVRDFLNKSKLSQAEVGKIANAFSAGLVDIDVDESTGKVREYGSVSYGSRFSKSLLAQPVLNSSDSKTTKWFFKLIKIGTGLGGIRLADGDPVCQENERLFAILTPVLLPPIPCFPIVVDGRDVQVIVGNKADEADDEKDAAVLLDSDQLAKLELFREKFWGFFSGTKEDSSSENPTSEVKKSYHLVPTRVAPSDSIQSIFSDRSFCHNSFIDWKIIDKIARAEYVSLYDWTHFIKHYREQNQGESLGFVSHSIRPSDVSVDDIKVSTTDLNKESDAFADSLFEFLDEEKMIDTELEELTFGQTEEALDTEVKNHKRKRSAELVPSGSIPDGPLSFEDAFEAALSFSCSLCPSDGNHDVLQDLRDSEILSEMEKSLQQLVIVMPHSNMLYGLRNVNFSLNPLSPLQIDRYPEIKNYVEYAHLHQYDITHQKSPLFDAFHVKPSRNFLRGSRKNDKNDKVHTIVQLVPDSAKVLPFPMELFQIATILPSVMYRVEAFCLIHEVVEEAGSPPVSLDDALAAFTSPSTLDRFNYERLETLGDAVLKFASSLDLFLKKDKAGEGELSLRRGALVSNRNLYKIAVRLGIGSAIFIYPFHPKFWALPGRIVDLTQTRVISEKRLADVVEAWIGAVYLKGGLPFAFDLLCKIGIVSPSWKTYLNHSVQRPGLDVSRPQETEMIEVLERMITYRFIDADLAQQALRHSSANMSQSYERLEFLGDALLDCLLMTHFFKSYPSLPPDRLCDLRQAAVNNESFCRLTVKLGLHKLLVHSSPVLQGQIGAYLLYLSQHDLSKLHPTDTTHEGPKVLGDLFEAVVGAVFIDSGRSITSTWQIFGPLLQGFLDEHVTLDIVEKSVIRQMHEYFQKAGFGPSDIRYEFTEQIAQDSIYTSYTSSIFLCEVEISKKSGNSRTLAKRLACKAALEWIENNSDTIETMLAQKVALMAGAENSEQDSLAISLVATSKVAKDEPDAPSMEKKQQSPATAPQALESNGVTPAAEAMSGEPMTSLNLSSSPSPAKPPRPPLLTVKEAIAESWKDPDVPAALQHVLTRPISSVDSFLLGLAAVAKRGQKDEAKKAEAERPTEAEQSTQPKGEATESTSQLANRLLRELQAIHDKERAELLAFQAQQLEQFLQGLGGNGGMQY